MKKTSSNLAALAVILLIPAFVFVFAFFFTSEYRSEELDFEKEKHISEKFIAERLLTQDEIDYLKRQNFKYLEDILRSMSYKDKGRAYKLYQEAIKLGMESQDAYEFLAEMYVNRNEKDKAIVLYKKAVSLDPEVKLWQTKKYIGILANLCRETGQYGEASVYYEKILGFYDRSIKDRYQLAVCYFMLNRLEDSINQLNKCIAMDPANEYLSDIHNLLGLVYEKQGFTEEARRNYTEALRVKPTNTDAENNLKRIGKTDAQGKT